MRKVFLLSILFIIFSTFISAEDNNVVELSREYFESRNYWKARSLLEADYNKGNHNKKLIELLGQVYSKFILNDVEKENYDEIEYYLSKIKKINYKTNLINYFNGIVSYNQEDYKKTIALLKSYLNTGSKYPQLKDIYYDSLKQYSKELYKSGEYNDSLKFVNEYLSYNNDCKDMLFLKGKLFYSKGDYKGAIIILNGLVEVKNIEPEVHYYLGLSYKSIKKYEKSISYLKKSLKKRKKYKTQQALLNSYKLLYSMYENNKQYKKAIKVTDDWLNIFYNNKDALYYKGLCYYKLKKYGDAKDFFKKVQKLDHSYKNISSWLSKTYLYLGLEAKNKKDYKKALYYFKYSVFYDIHQGDAYFKSGEILYKQKKYAVAKKLLLNSLKEKSYLQYTLYYLGKIEFYDKNYSQSINYLEKLYSLSPEFKDIKTVLSLSYYNIALKEFNSHNFSDSILYLKKSLQFDKYYQPVWYLLGRNYFNKNEYSSAKEWFEKLFAKNREFKKVNSLLSKTYFQLGISAYSNGDFTKSISYEKKSLNLLSNFVEALYILGISYIETNSYNNGILSLKKVLTKEENHKETLYWLAEGYYRWGMSLYNKKRYDDAIKKFKASESFDRNKKDSLYQLGVIFVKYKNWKLAESYLDRVFNLEEDYKDTKILLRKTYIALAYNNLGKKPDIASNYFKKIVSIFSSDGEAHYNLGLINYNKKSYGDALSSLKIALNQQYKSNDTKYYLGKIYSVKEQWLDAISYLEELYRAKKSYKDTKVLLEEAYYNVGKSFFLSQKYSEAVSYLAKAYKLNKNRLETLYFIGLSNYNLNRYSEAEKELTLLLKLNGYKNYKDCKKILIFSLLNLANNEKESGNLNKSVKYAKRVISLDNMNIEANYLLGDLYLLSSLYQKSINSFLKVYQTDRNYQNIKIKLHEVYSKEAEKLYSGKNISKAIRYMEDAIKYDSSNYDDYIILSKWYENIGNSAKSLSILKLLLKMSPDHQEALWLLCKSYFNLNKYERSIYYGEQLAKLNNNYTGLNDILYKNYITLGKHYYSTKSYLKAEELFRKGMTLKENLPDINFWYGKSLYVQKKYEEVLPVWRKLLTLNYNRSSYISQYENTLKSIILSNWKSRYNERIVSLLEERLKFAVQDKWNILMLAYSYYLNNNYQKSIDLLRKLNGVTVSFKSVPLTSNKLLGLSLYSLAKVKISQQEWYNAVKLLEESNKLVSKDDILFLLGKSYFSIGKYVEAESYFIKSIAENSSDSKTLYYLGKISLIKKHYKVCIDYWEKYTKFGGDIKQIADEFRDVFIFLANKSEGTKDYQNSILYLQKAQQIKYGDQEQLKLGKLYYLKKDLDNSITAYENVKGSLNNEAKDILYNLYLIKGNNALEKQNFSDAEKLLLKAKSYKLSKDVISKLITVFYNLQDNESVISTYIANRNRVSDKIKKNVIYSTLIIVGSNNIGKNNKKAVSYLTEAAKINNSDAVKYYLGKAYYQVKNYKKSLEELNSIIEEGVFFNKAQDLIPKISYEYGVYEVENGSAKNGLQLLTNVVEEYSDNEIFQYEMAKALYLTGDYKNAYDYCSNLYNKYKKVKYYKLFIKISKRLNR